MMIRIDLGRPWSRQEYDSWLREAWRRTRVIYVYWINAGVFLLLEYLALVGHLEDGRQIGIVLILSALPMVLLPGFVRNELGKRYERRALEEASGVLEIDHEGISFENESANYQVTWDGVHSIREAEGYFVIPLKNSGFVILKNRHEAETICELRGILRDAPVTNKRMLETKEEPAIADCQLRGERGRSWFRQ